MWSYWLVFCDCGFHSVSPLMEKDKRLTEASWWERLTEGETGSCSDEWGHAQQILIQFSVEALGLSSLLFDLSQNYGVGNKDNVDLFQNVPCIHCYTCVPNPAACQLTHISTRECWTLTGKSGSVSCEVTAPFSWVLVHTSFCLFPLRDCFPSPM